MSAPSTSAGPSEQAIVIADTPSAQASVTAADDSDANDDASGAATLSNSRKKKKKKSKGKSTALDKLKALATSSKKSGESSNHNGNNVATSVNETTADNDDDDDNPGPGVDGASDTNTVPHNKAAPPISDDLFRRIRQQAAANGQDVSKLDRQSVQEMVEALNLRDVVSGKSTGINASGKNKKDMADFKFWSTQPVPRIGSLSTITPDGPIEKDKPLSEVRQEPYPLPKDFEWCTMDLADPVQLKEVYELLTNNYVEDVDATFRFDYSAEFIQWALQPPGFIKDWHVGVRVSASKRLVAFIAGIPMDVRIRHATKRCSEINYLCVHKKLRSKRLAPVLIKEVTRRCNVIGVFQAVYTVGSYLPTPITACQYYHRALNMKKLVETGFSSVPRSTTLARMIVKNKVPDTTAIPGLREMEERDLRQVSDLLRAYLARFDIAPVMTDEEVRHNFLSGRGHGSVDSRNGHRQQQVTWAYVVEDPDTHRITDFFSFYSLPSTAIRMNPPQTIQAAYLFYYATADCPTCQSLLPTSSSQSSSSVVNWEKESPEERSKLKLRLNALVLDCLSISAGAKFDVFNSLTLMDNNLFLSDQKFGSGDGTLFFYLYNYQTRPIAGGCVEPAAAAAGVRSTSAGQVSGGFIPEKGSGVGLVML